MEDRPINYNLLHKDELEYEVSIRDVTPAGDVKSLREQIRKLARELPSDDIAEFEGQLAQELTVVQKKLGELEESTTAAKSPITLKSLNRVQALGHHLYHRLTRIKPVESTDVTSHSELMERLMRILSKLDNMLSVFVSTHSNAAFTDAVEGVEPPAQTETSPAVPNASCFNKYQTVSSLNLKFNGRSCVKAFLQRVEELAASRRITEARLLASAVELFDGDALMWYRGIRTEVSTWDQLKAALIEEFLPFDYDRRLLKEIRNRTQGSNENISTYISIMQNYFSRLNSELSDQEKFDIVSINVRPEYTVPLAIQSVTTLKDLKRVCRVLEDSWQRANAFVEPPRPSSSTLAADLSFKSSSRPKVEAAHTMEKPFCVRCRVDTHSLRECKSKRVVCFKCGKGGVTYPDCPNCLSQASTSSSSHNDDVSGASKN
ncbi:uncharacterized protein LOC125237805 [Leguminivora glycinivorella]|uniref:uncharacterized protein LOC125237805 n=1 Tax=Leguminivora glycinivorella TaxID=1035111 RepID=UPI00200FAE23|nr:uncharacterized protein LOC125237805 [Leguminivora glycinivorella]